MDSSAGAELHQRLLRHGGAKDPTIVIANALGHCINGTAARWKAKKHETDITNRPLNQPNIDFLLRDLGL